MKIKSIILTIVFSMAILFISLTNVKAVTITETTEDDKYDTIADNTIIIGVTKFEPNEVLTAGKASLATFNDFIFNMNGEDYKLPKIYYYLQGSWFIIDEENAASVVEDKKELEDLKSLDIYYVNNEEKMLEVPYEIGLEKGHELVFKSNDSGKDEQIQYKDGVIHIPATLHTVTVAIKETQTGAMTEIETLTKTEDNNTAFKSSTAEVATKEELKAALEDKTITKIILNADITGLTETLTISRTMEFDGNGHTITGNKNIFHVLGTEATLTINNVKLVANDSATAIKVGEKKLGTDKKLKAVIGEDVEITAKYFGVTVFGENSTVDFYGKINITEDGYGIAGNGLEEYAGKTVINIKEGSEIKANKETGIALYLPQDGTVNIEGGTLEGASVVAIKSGTLNVTGGTLKATGAKVALPSASYNGKAQTGDVIAVEVNESYAGGQTNKNIKINITGGTLESANAYAIREVNVDSSDIEIEVTGLYNIKNVVAENVNTYGKEVEVSNVSDLETALTNVDVVEVNITKNVELTKTLEANHTVTVNGNGKTITGDNINLFHVTGTDTVLTINNAKLVATENGTAVKVGDKNLGKGKNLKAVIGEDVEIIAKYFGVTVFGENSTVDFYGKINITDDGYGIAGNGLEEYAGKTVINIKEGAEIKANAETGIALYLPQDGTVNIEGGKLEGASVVAIKSGILNVTGGTLKATGAKVALPSASYNGKAQTGDVIAVEVNESYAGGQTDKNIKINVTGGTLESKNAYIIREVNVDSSDIEIEVTGLYNAKTSVAENVNIYGKEAEVTTVNELKTALADKKVTELNITEDVEITETLEANHTVTVNGNGKTITGDDINLFHVTGTDTVLTINNAKLVATEDGAAVKVGDKNLGTDKKLKAVIGKDVEITAKYFGVTVFGENSTVDFYGKINITDDGYGIAGNGLEEYAGKTVINIKEGSEIKANAETGIALYLPQDGTVNIEGGTLEGASVVAIKSGTLNVIGGTLKATGAKVALPSATYNGKAQTGDVIAVEVNESYAGGQTDKNIKINVTGGTLTSTNAYRIREVNVDSSDITIDVKGLYSVKNELAETVNVYEAE